MIFVAKGLFDNNSRMNFIMNCDSKYHADIRKAIESYGRNTDQVMISSQEIYEIDTIGSFSPGGLVQSKINGYAHE